MARVVLAVDIIAREQGASEAMMRSASGVDRFAAASRRAAPVAKGVLIALGGIGAAAVKQASDLQQAAGSVEAVFGASADAVHKLGSQAAQTVGLASSQYQQLASVLGSQLKNLGTAQDALVPSTQALIAQGADLAATYGGTTEEAVQALSAALRGETDPIERYGISVNQAAVNAELAAKGQDKLTGAALAQAQTQARLAIITRQSAAAQGQFGREADTAAGQQARAAAATKDALANLGTAALPLVAGIAGALSKVATFVSANAGVFRVLAVAVGVVAAAVLAMNAALSISQGIMLAVRIATLAWSAAQAVLNVVLSANPIGLIILGVAALIAGLVLLYQRSATFRAIVQAVGAAGVAAFSAIWSVLKVVGAFVAGVFVAYWRTIIAVFRAVAAAGVATWAAIVAGAQRVAAVARSVGAAIAAAFSAAWGRARAVALAVIGAVVAAHQRLASAARSVGAAVASAFASAFGRVRAVATAALNAALAPARELIGLVRSVIGAVGRIRFPSAPSWLGRLPGLRAAATTRAAGVASRVAGLAAGSRQAPLVRVGGAGAAGGSGAVVVNVYGALDPEAVARQIAGVLGSAQVRRAGTVRTLRVPR